MKKRLSLLLAVFLLLNLGALPAAAAGQTYELPELYLTLEVPEDFLVFTRDMSEEDTALLAMGMSPEELREDFTKNNVYMNAMSLSPLYEIIVTMQEYEGSQEIFDFTALGERKLGEMADLLLQGEAGQGKGLIYDTYRIETVGPATFMVLDLHQEAGGSTIYGRQYYTIFNGQAINLTLQSYTGPVSDEMGQALREVVSSVKFTTVLENPNPPGISFKWIMAGLTLAAAVIGIGMVAASKYKQKKEDAAAAQGQA